MAVGHRTCLFVDARRAGRTFVAEAWYPAEAAGATLAAPRTRYELLPGMGFEAVSAVEAEPGEGPFPLVIWSHGRTGMRFANSLLCEAIAGRGHVVIALDHPGDTLADSLLGTAVDDRTNELQRLEDGRFVLDQVLGSETQVDDPALRAAIDATQIVAAGHSYGAYTALGSVAGHHGVAADTRVRAAIGVEPLTRPLSDAALERIEVPVLMVVAARDTTTPPERDADRPWRLIPGRPLWRVDLARAAHQASSDMGLYVELAPRIANLPSVLVDYLAESARDAVADGLAPWRENLLVHLDAITAFIETVLDVGSRGVDGLRRLGDFPDVTLEVASR